MELLNVRRKTMLLLLAVLIAPFVHAQTRGLVLDIETYLPISYVNIYTTHRDNVSGTTTNALGKYEVNFPFKSLSFSHINYEKEEVSSDDLKDTIFLKPKTTLIGEIVISSKQPEWISGVLKQFIARKSETYQLSDKRLSYRYKTYTLNDSSGYAFSSKGDIIVPSLKKDAPFQISTQENIIHYKDNSAGMDFSNMQRILYDNFIADFNREFIKEHEFKQNYAYKSNNKDMVQLMFSSKEFDCDDGYIVIDTASCVIVEAERNSGTKFNVKEHTSGAIRAIASEMKGFSYEEWVTNNYIQFKDIGGSYYPIDCKYKIYLKSSTKNKKQNEDYFVSIESELLFGDNVATETEGFINMPRPYYMLLIRTKKMRQDEERLQKLPVTFDKF